MSKLKDSSFYCGGVIGSVVVCLIFMCIHSCRHNPEQSEWYIIEDVATLNQELTVDKISTENTNSSRTISKTGRLLTIDEYTEHISYYYQTLIAVLISLFILLSFGSAWAMRITAKKEIDDLLNGSEQLIKKHTNEYLENKLMHLTQFKEDVITKTSTIIGNELVKKEELDNINEELKQLKANVDTVEQLYYKLEEDVNKEELE